MKSPILMLGTARDVRGGISSVVNAYFSSELIKDYEIIYIATHVDGGKLRKLLIFFKAIISSIRYLFSSKIKLVHIHSASRASFYRKSVFVILSKVFRKKVIIHIHGGGFNIFYHNESGTIKRKYIKNILCLADIIIALSDQWKKDIETIISKEHVVRVVNNGIVLPLVKHTIEVKNLIILMMGRLGEKKGVFDLIKAIEKIVRVVPTVQFILAGDGDIDKVKKIVQEKELSEYISVPGWVSNGSEYYSNADIYVLPSYNEGLPMSILEASSYGLPVVSTSVGGIPEIIEDGLNGFLVEPGDINALEERLLSLIESPELRRKMGNAAHEKVKDKFNINHIAGQISKLYEELLHQ